MGGKRNPWWSIPSPRSRYARSTVRTAINIAAVFVAVGLGALTVILLHDPGALVPRPPYIQWVFALFALASLGMILVLGVVEDVEERDDEGSRGFPVHWRAVGLAYLTSALATATFIGASALVNYLDRALS